MKAKLIFPLIIILFTIGNSYSASNLVNYDQYIRCSFNGLYTHNKTFLQYACTDKYTYAMMIDHSNGRIFRKPLCIPNTVQYDDHNFGGIEELYNGNMIMTANPHQEPKLYYGVSATPYNIDFPAMTLNTERSLTYSQLCRLSIENNKVFLFARCLYYDALHGESGGIGEGVDNVQDMGTFDNEGTNFAWSTHCLFQDNDGLYGSPYVFFQSNNINKIYFIFVLADTAGTGFELMCFYYQSDNDGTPGSFYNLKGELIRTFDNLPVRYPDDYSKVTNIYTCVGSEELWSNGLYVDWDNENNLKAGAIIATDSTWTTKREVMFKWNPSTQVFDEHELDNDGKTVMGLNIVDKNTIVRGLDNDTRTDLSVWKTTDYGVTWAKDHEITTSDPGSNDYFIAFPILNGRSDLRYLYHYGTKASPTSWAMQLMTDSQWYYKGFIDFTTGWDELDPNGDIIPNLYKLHLDFDKNGQEGHFRYDFGDEPIGDLDYTFTLTITSIASAGIFRCMTFSENAFDGTYDYTAGISILFDSTGTGDYLHKLYFQATGGSGGTQTNFASGTYYGRITKVGTSVNLKFYTNYLMTGTPYTDLTSDCEDKSYRYWSAINYGGTNSGGKTIVDLMDVKDMNVTTTLHNIIMINSD